MSTPALALAEVMPVVAERWRALFEQHSNVLCELVDGARVGFVARADFVPQAGRHLAGLVDAGARARGAPMLLLEMRGGAMTVGDARFEGFERAELDLLFVADDDALAELVRAGAPNVLAVVKRALRIGSVVFYALKPKHELQDSGYEDFLDSLGLAFLGACR